MSKEIDPNPEPQQPLRTDGSMEITFYGELARLAEELQKLIEILSFNKYLNRSD